VSKSVTRFETFSQADLHSCIRLQRFSEVVFDLLDQGRRFEDLGERAEADDQVVPKVQTVPAASIIQSLSFDFPSLRSGQALGSNR